VQRWQNWEEEEADKMRKLGVGFLVAAIVIACSPPSQTAGGRNAMVITKEEIAASHMYNAYDVISSLRPAFFHSHGPTTFSAEDNGLPKVYLNHMVYGSIESLKTMEVSGIQEIHYYNGTEASNRFGLGNVSGAIEIITDVR
jgi:hypothetical protein